jgi:hypothetical protein
MYAGVGQVRSDPAREDEARSTLEERGVPMVKGLQGSVEAYWAKGPDSDIQHSIWLFDSEDNARAAAAMFGQGPPPGAPATFVSVEVCEVIGQT